MSFTKPNFAMSGQRRNRLRLGTDPTRGVYGEKIIRSPNCYLYNYVNLLLCLQMNYMKQQEHNRNAFDSDKTLFKTKAQRIFVLARLRFWTPECNGKEDMQPQPLYDRGEKFSAKTKIRPDAVISHLFALLLPI
jgi:hypothetical protein